MAENVLADEPDRLESHRYYVMLQAPPYPAC
ncbi:hypothetical protein FHX03_006001 [Rhizobium sp. BK456]|nr:hypothetical protein [Rhizobium sp. BK456]